MREVTDKQTENQKTALVVLGMHRSGTSALARVLSLAGARLPRRLMQPRVGNNDLGFWEPQAVCDFNDQFLSELDLTWASTASTPFLNISEHLSEEHTSTASRILEEDYDAADRLVIKEPRMCRLLPVWLPALLERGYRPVGIHIHRHPLEVAASLQKRDGFSVPHSLRLWLSHVLIAERNSRGMPRAFVSFERLLGSPEACISTIEQVAQLGLAQDSHTMEAIVDFLSPQFRHHSVDSTAGLLAAAPDYCSEVFAALEQAVDGRGLTEEQQIRFDQILESVSVAEQLFEPDLALKTTELAILKKTASQNQEKLAALEQKHETKDGDMHRLAAEVHSLRSEVSTQNERLQQANKAAEAAVALSEQSQQALKRYEQALMGLRADLAVMREAIRQQEQDVFRSMRSLGRGQESSVSLKSRQSISSAKLSAWKPSAGWIRLALDVGLIDVEWLCCKYGYSEYAHIALRDWLKVGWKQGHNPSVYFDTSYYFENNPDVRSAGLNPLQHFILHGRFEQRLASVYVDAHFYLDAYPDVREQQVHPVWHYAAAGRHEGRKPNPFFEASFVSRSLEVSERGSELKEFALAPVSLRVSPGPAFDATYYLYKNPDVASSNLEPLFHYLSAGRRELRKVHPFFDAKWYLQTHQDLAPMPEDPLGHFLEHGALQGRVPGPNFKQALAAMNMSVEPEKIIDVFHDLARKFPLGFVGENKSKRVAEPAQKATAIQAEPARLPEDSDTEAAREALSQLPEPPSFSVVMPTWNRAGSIESAIRSVLQQSYEHWELLICDDGSTDQTIAILRREFSEHIDAGRLLILELPHLGVSAARNAGLAAAQYPIIAYLDSDNSWHPDYLLHTAAAYARDAGRRTSYTALQVEDRVRDKSFVRGRNFCWQDLLRQNYIDLNIFTHYRELYAQLGGFDQELTRLVDWDLILRYTQTYEPAYVPLILADYFIDDSLNNITLREKLESNERRVREKHIAAIRISEEASLRMAYVLWDWPALSQTFVLEEIREYLRRGVDVRVYHHKSPDRAAENLPQVPAYAYANLDELCHLLTEHGRNWLHSHFAYPGVTRFVWPAAERCRIPFSFMPHAVDIFHFENRKRNRIAEVAASPWCAQLLVHGEYHRRFLVEQGVPSHKLITTPQAVNLDALLALPLEERSTEVLRVLVIGRLIEKKGVQYLVQALSQLPRHQYALRVCGYGPELESLQGLVDELDAKVDVEFQPPFEGQEALAVHMQWADVLCLPCCEADNGDVDGMPTVFFEAMAAGTIVVSGKVSAIPDFIQHGLNGFLVPPKDSQVLARCLQDLQSLNASQRLAIRRYARHWVRTYVGSELTVDTQLDVCARPPLDIFMVTFCRDGYGHWEATQRAIQSVLQNTATPFVLTIVDNASEAAFRDRLREMAREDPRVRLLLLPENIYCGPASNIALAMARSEFAIYVCSNEGLVNKYGWERPLVNAMRAHPNAAQGGHLVASPSWATGRAYAEQEWFNSFRAPEFARANPDREFFHVQGGLYIIRTQVACAHGAFSPRRPQGLMDVELSYFYESLGFDLLDIPEVAAVSNKTRPGLAALVSETSLALHPVFDEEVEAFEALTEPGLARCNICQWSAAEQQRQADGVSFECPNCGSTPRDRLSFRSLADSNLHHRGLSLAIDTQCTELRSQLARMFTLVPADCADKEQVLRAAQLYHGRPSRALGIPPALCASEGRLAVQA